MPAVRSYASKTFAIDDTKFYAIAAPVACSTWSLRGTVDFLIRTDDGDSTTEDTVTAGTQEAAITTSHFIHQRFAAGETVIWAKRSAVGSTVLVGKFFD